ncbi:MAG: hypothetical protein EOM19_03815 [Candidatus Moranbacteria bacterium]|nr:hypothetical protein [Candidatus Moranbacteria bacterium]
MNATRYASVIGSDYLAAGRHLGDLLAEIQLDPHLDALEAVEEAANTVKLVSWEVVRNITNVMTNQFYLGGPDVDIERAHMSTSSFGGRDWTLEPGRTGKFLSGGNWGGWWAFDEMDVSRLFLLSATSRSGIEATKLSSGVWKLRFIPSPNDPTYRGCYYSLFMGAEGVKNIDPEYVRGNR